MRLDVPTLATGDNVSAPHDVADRGHPAPAHEDHHARDRRRSRGAVTTRRRGRPHRRPPAVRVIWPPGTDNAKLAVPLHAGSAAGGVPCPGLLALAVLQVWVWGASAIPKLTSLRFVQGFGGFIATPSPGRPALYQQLVVRGALAAPGVVAWASLLLETTLALAFIGVSMMVVRGQGILSRGTRRVAVAASLVSAGFAVNLALLVGDPAPWSLENPFDSGVSLEYLVAGLALAGLAVVWHAGRVDRARASSELLRI